MNAMAVMLVALCIAALAAISVAAVVYIKGAL